MWKCQLGHKISSGTPIWSTFTSFPIAVLINVSFQREKEQEYEYAATLNLVSKFRKPTIHAWHRPYLR
jgi:hypothetical protein